MSMFSCGFSVKSDISFLFVARKSKKTTQRFRLVRRRVNSQSANGRRTQVQEADKQQQRDRPSKKPRKSSKNATEHEANKASKHKEKDRARKTSSDDDEEIPQDPPQNNSSDESHNKKKAAKTDFSGGLIEIKAQMVASEANSKKSDMEHQINMVVKTYAWPCIKFLKDKADQFNAAVFVMNHLGHSKLKMKDGQVKLNEDQLNWVNDYQKTVSQAINKTRNYVSTEMRKRVWKYLVNNEGDLPEVDLIEQILSRTIDHNKPENQKIIAWWIGEVMPVFPANAKKFTENKRYYATISQVSSFYDGKKMTDLPPSCEAFGVLCYDNNRSKWLNCHKTKVEKGVSQVIVRSKRGGKAPKDQKALVVYANEETKYQTKYSAIDKGRSDLGGWSDEGMINHCRLKKICKKARKSKEGKAAELKYLEILQAEKQVAAKNPEDEKAKKEEEKVKQTEVKVSIWDWRK